MNDSHIYLDFDTCVCF